MPRETKSALAEMVKCAAKAFMNRQTCTPENPMPKGAKGRWEHTNAHEVGDQEDGYPGGDIVRYRCDNCGHTWETELPQ